MDQEITQEIENEGENENINDCDLTCYFLIGQEPSTNELENQTKEIEIIKKWVRAQVDVDHLNLKLVLYEANFLSHLKLSSNQDSLKMVGSIHNIKHYIKISSVLQDFELSDEILFDEASKIKELASSWRKIKGDGNCFYRAVMFGYLERILLTRDKQSLINLIAKAKLMVDTIKEDSTNLFCKFKSEVSYDFIQILLFFLEQIDTSMEASYSMIIKAINNIKSFDLGLVMYLRYYTFDFLNQNFNKYYSVRFNVKLGNLLPSHYENNNGEFNLNQYFKEELLTLDQYAEKVSIYLACFVLNINLNIVSYNLMGDVDENTFSCELKEKENLILILNSSHYDLAYNNSFVSSFRAVLTNLKDNLCIDESIKEVHLYSYYDSEVKFTMSCVYCNSEIYQTVTGSSRNFIVKNAGFQINDYNLVYCLICEICAKTAAINRLQDCKKSSEKQGMQNMLQIVQTSIPVYIEENGTVYIEMPLIKLFESVIFNSSKFLQELKTKFCFVCLSFRKDVRSYSCCSVCEDGRCLNVLKSCARENKKCLCSQIMSVEELNLLLSYPYCKKCYETNELIPTDNMHSFWTDFLCFKCYSNENKY